MKKIILFISIFLNIVTLVYSQTNQNLPLSADSLATGNYKDVLGSFFQLAFDKFTSTEKELRFTSNPFAVMAKMDTSLLRDREYYKYRHLRDLNFSFSAKLDSSYKFNGFSSGLKYALINRRDETVSHIFIHDVLHDSTVQDLQSLNLSLEQYFSTFANDTAAQDKLRNQKTKFFRGEINFDQLDKDFQQKIKQLAKEKKLDHLSGIIKADAKFNIKKTSGEIYKDVKEKINNKLLWTVGVSDTTYKDQFMFSNIVLSSDLVKGIDKMKSKDIELNLKAAMQFVDDSLKTGRDLKRSVFSFEPGFNLVLKNKNTLKSFFEFKLSGSYYHTFSALYIGEKKDSLTFNGTIRIRIYNDIWIPLEIKYDPYSGNVFGFLNVRANFTALGKIAKTLVN
jgi:hypothetical protein